MSVYQIDGSHSSVEFAVKHLMISNVKGRFTKVAGELTVDGANPLNSSVEASAEIASIDTHDPQRDGHLRSPDFFDADKYPTMTFKSRRLEKAKGEDEYKLTGDLTIRDVTREVVFDLTFLGQGADPWGNARVGFSATTAINRRDYGLVWNTALESGGVLVGDQVKINIEAEAIKKA